MRHTWAETYRTWVDSVGHDVTAIWVIGKDTTTAADFVDGFDLAGARIATLARGGAEDWRKLGAVATPMAYLVDPEGVVQGGKRGPKFPSASLAQAACSRR